MLGTAVSQLPPDDDSDASRADAERFALSTKLLDSLLHDARNPLNALSINIEVLAEKLRLQSGGTIPPTQEKNLKAMRDQIHRVDDILRLFAPFIAQVPSRAEVSDLADVVQRSSDVLGHESRRARMRLVVKAAGAVNVQVIDAAMLRFVLTRILLAGLESGPAGQDLIISVGVEGGRGVVRVGAAPQPSAGLSAIETFARQLGAEWSNSGREMRLSLPLA